MSSMISYCASLPPAYSILLLFSITLGNYGPSKIRGPIVTATSATSLAMPLHGLSGIAVLARNCYLFNWHTSCYNDYLPSIMYRINTQCQLNFVHLRFSICKLFSVQQKSEQLALILSANNLQRTAGKKPHETRTPHHFFLLHIRFEDRPCADCTQHGIQNKEFPIRTVSS